MATKAQSKPQNPLTLLTEREVAELLGVSVKTLQKWRWQGKGPRFLKLSRNLVRYEASRVESFLAGCVRDSTTVAGGAQ